MQIIDLFSGIGGFSLAGRWVGWHTVQFCEIDPFCQKVLAHHFPNVPISNNIKTLTREEIEKNGKWNPAEPTIVVGGFPCQPFSAAGKRKGTADDRHLWPEMLRIIREVQPTYIVGENVGGLLNWNGGLVFDQVQADLEAAGYEVASFVLPACGVNAPHRRDRVWIVAHSNIRNRKENGLQTGRKVNLDRDERTGITADTTGIGCIQRGQGDNRPYEDGTTDRPEQVCEENAPNTKSEGLERKNRKRMDKSIKFAEQFTPDTSDHGLQGSKVDRSTKSGRAKRNKQPAGCVPPIWDNFPTQSPVRLRNDGVSTKLVDITFSKWRNESIKALGNAIVPQVAKMIFKAIESEQWK